jgi:hypothetical protein
MIQPCRARSAALVAVIWSATSASGPLISVSSAVLRYAPQNTVSAGSSNPAAVNPGSSMTTALSSPSGSPSAMRRAGVMKTGSPTRFNGTRCAAARAAALVTPGITVYSKSTAPRASSRSMIRSVES